MTKNLIIIFLIIFLQHHRHYLCYHLDQNVILLQKEQTCFEELEYSHRSCISSSHLRLRDRKWHSQNWASWKVWRVKRLLVLSLRLNSAEDPTYDTNSGGGPRVACAKAHYGYCRNKGHIVACYKREGTAPAVMQCQVWVAVKENPSRSFRTCRTSLIAAD